MFLFSTLLTSSRRLASFDRNKSRTGSRAEGTEPTGGRQTKPGGTLQVRKSPEWLSLLAFWLFLAKAYYATRDTMAARIMHCPAFLLRKLLGNAPPRSAAGCEERLSGIQGRPSNKRACHRIYELSASLKATPSVEIFYWGRLRLDRLSRADQAIF